jgi:hypothetical protein
MNRLSLIKLSGLGKVQSGNGHGQPVNEGS